jgi:hypothetical protein
MRVRVTDPTLNECKEETYMRACKQERHMHACNEAAQMHACNKQRNMQPSCHTMRRLTKEKMCMQ